MPRRLKKLTEEVVHANPWWSYVHDTYERPDGQIGDYWYGRTRGGVIIVPRLPDGRLVLTLQHRYIDDKQSIAFPMGGIGEGLDIAAAALRELHEETGYRADGLIKIGNFQPSSGLVDDLSHVYLADVSEQGDQFQDPTEDIEVLYRRPDEVDRMIRSNEIWCGQSIASWALVRHYFLGDE